MNCIKKTKIENPLHEKTLLYLGVDHKNQICFATWGDYRKALDILEGDEELLMITLIESQGSDTEPENTTNDDVRDIQKKSIFKRRCCGQ